MHTGSSEKIVCWPALIAIAAAVLSSVTFGYAYGYTSTALEELGELPDGYSFHLGTITGDMFAVSLCILCGKTNK